MMKSHILALAVLGASACAAPPPGKPANPPAAAAAPTPQLVDTTTRPASPAPAPTPRLSVEQQNLIADRSIAARTMGVPRAPITIYEISDFQCPYCREFAVNTLPSVEREFVNTGRARIIFVNFPIPQLHPNAVAAHEFAMCAADQSKFWPVHNLLYRHQDDWAKLSDPRPYFQGLGDSVRLGKSALQNCLTTGQIEGLLRSDVQTAAQNGIHSTPSFVINGALLPGAVPFNVLRPILDSIYLAATTTH